MASLHAHDASSRGTSSRNWSESLVIRGPLIASLPTLASRSSSGDGRDAPALMVDHGVLTSVGSVGDAIDTALAESFKT